MILRKPVDLKPLALVTGGAGFLGSHLVDALIRAGREVIVVDNLSSGNVANLKDAIKSGKASFVHADVSESAVKLSRNLQPTIRHRWLSEIFHFASPASPEAYSAHPWETLQVNGLGTMSLIDLALEHSARFLFASTSEVYGDPLVHPQPETYFGNVDPIGERACYDEGKRFGEAAVSVAVRSRGLDARLVRFFNCYGPRMSAADGRLIPALNEAVATGRPLPIHGDGTQTRSMTFVDDAIDLVQIIMERGQTTLSPVNIGNDEERSVLEIAEAFARAAGVTFNVEYVRGRPGDPRRRRPELTLARQLGWTPRVGLDEGLRITLDWMRNSGLSQAI